MSFWRLPFLQGHGDSTAMSQQPEPDGGGGPAVGPEKAPDDVDTSPTPQDGPQDVDQDPNYEEGESDDNEDDDDLEVHEVGR
jgi:hypothetical protein